SISYVTTGPAPQSLGPLPGPSSIVESNLSRASLQSVIDETLTIWELLDTAYLTALRANDLTECSEICSYYPSLPTCPPENQLQDFSQIMEDILEYHFRPDRCARPDGLPKESKCQFQSASPPPSCRDCIPGILICKRHRKHCNKPCWITCGRCQRLVCFDHALCFCQL